MAKPSSTEIVSKGWSRLEYAKRAHDKFHERAQENENFYAGGDKQWNEGDIARLKNEERPYETINLTKHKVNAATNFMVDNKVDLSFSPSDNFSDPAVANLLSKLSRYIDNNNAETFSEIDLFEDGIVRSRGFVDIRMDYDTSDYGDIRMTLKNPHNIIIDPDADQYSPNTWRDFHEVKFLSFHDIEMLFGKKKAAPLKFATMENRTHPLAIADTHHLNEISTWQEDVQRLPMGQEQMRYLPLIRVVSRQWKQLTQVTKLVDPETGDLVQVSFNANEEEVQELAEKYNAGIRHELGYRIRWTVFANDTLLFDDWSPYRTYTIIPYFPYFRWGVTQGMVDDLKGPQRMLNKAVSHEIHIISASANSGWMVEEDSLVNMDADELEAYGAKTGLVVVYKAGAEKPEKINPNQVPTGMDLLATRAGQFIDQVSNVPKGMVGQSREDVAARAIQEDKATGGFNLNRMVDNFNKTRRLIAQKKLELIQDFMTETRMFRITGFDKAHPNSTEVFTINSAVEEVKDDVTIGKYDVIIDSVPDRATWQDQQFEEAKQLKELGINIPDHIIVRNSHLEGKNDIADSLEHDPSAERRVSLELQKMEIENQETMANAKKRAAEAEKTLIEAYQLQEQGDPVTMEHQRESRQIELKHVRDMRVAQLQSIKDMFQTAETLKTEREKSLMKTRIETAMNKLIQLEQEKNKPKEPPKPEAKPTPKKEGK